MLFIVVALIHVLIAVFFNYTFNVVLWLNAFVLVLIFVYVLFILQSASGSSPSMGNVGHGIGIALIVAGYFVSWLFAAIVFTNYPAYFDSWVAVKVLGLQLLMFGLYYGLFFLIGDRL